MILQQQLKFRFDIQGLRAVAVLGVVVFHLNPGWLPGGFVGVDVFFVISGYLITAMLVQMPLDRGAIYRFYASRVLRLFPAYFVMIATCALAAYFFLFPEETVFFAESLIASLVYLSNVYFSANINYFTRDPHLLPLLHTWSLSVEAQFYLIYPLMAFYLLRFNPLQIKLALISLCLMMFVFCLILTAYNQDIAYFAAPVRFYQFLAGAVIVFFPSFRLPVWLMELCLLLGLTLILFAFFFLSQNTTYPGIYSLLPTIGSLLVIFSGLNQAVFTAKLLTNKLMLFLGGISYSLYLWHLPVIVYYKVAVTARLTWHDVLLVMFVTLSLSVFSWLFIENKFRKIYQAAKPSKIMNSSLMITSLIIAVALGLIAADGAPGRYSKQSLSFLEYDVEQKSKQARLTDGCVVYKSAIESFVEKKCINVSPGKTNLLLFGDSYAEHFRHVLHDQVDKVNLSVVIVSGCRPGLPATGRQVCVDMLDKTYNDLILRYDFDVVLVSARWTRRSIAAMPMAITKLKENIDRVILLGPVVNYARSLPRLLARYGAGNEQTPLFQRQSYYGRQKKMDESLFQVAQTQGVEYISVLNLICPAGRCKTVTDSGAPMQIDYGHLSYEGASELINQMYIFD